MYNDVNFNERHQKSLNNQCIIDLIEIITFVIEEL